MTFDGFWLSLAGYAGTVLVGVWTFAWRLSGLKAAMDRRIDLMERDAIEKEAALRRDTVQSVDDATKAMGEGLAAIRQKAIDVELWGRDNYVRRTDFQNVVDSFTRSIEALRTEMNAGYLRLDNKLDRLLRMEESK